MPVRAERAAPESTDNPIDEERINIATHHSASQQTEITHETLSPASLAMKLSEYEKQNNASNASPRGQPTLKELIHEASKKKSSKEKEARRTHAGSKIGNEKRFLLRDNALSE